MATLDVQNDELSLPGNGNNGALVPIDGGFESLPGTGWPTTSAGRPEILDAKPSPAGLLHALRRRWPLAVALGLLVGFVAMALIWFVVPVRFESYAYLRVLPKALGGGASVDVGEGTDFLTYKIDQLSLVKNDIVLDTALRTVENLPTISRLPLIRRNNWLSNELSVDFPGNASMMKVSMKGESADDIRKIVDAVVEAYMNLNVYRDSQTLKERIAKFEEQVTEISNALKSKRQELDRKIKAVFGGTRETRDVRKNQLVNSINSLHATVNSLQQKLSNVETEMKLLDKKKDMMTDAKNGLKVSERAVESELAKDEEIRALRDTRRKYADMLNSSTRMNPVTKGNLLKQLQTVEEQLDERIATVKPQIITDLLNGKSGEDTVDRLPLFEEEAKILREQLVEAQGKLTQEEDKILDFDKSTTEISDLQYEVDRKSEVLKKLSVDLDTLNAQVKIIDNGRVIKMSDATLGRVDDSLRKYLTMGFSGLLGFFAMCFGVALIEFQRHHLNHSEEIKDGLGLFLLGNLPPLSGKTYARMQSPAGAPLRAQLYDSIDNIRSALIYSSLVDDARVVMVTSADSQEGKTTVACQLAASLARSARKTLLIDADLRRPSAHRVFDVAQTPGLSELLRKQADRNAVCYPTEQPNLWLLPSGQADQICLQILSSGGLDHLLSTLKMEFDFIIIDTGAVLQVSEPLVIGQHVDATILSVRRDISRIDQVYDAYQRLRSVGITVLGAVVNSEVTKTRRTGQGYMLPESVE